MNNDFDGSLLKAILEMVSAAEPDTMIADINGKPVLLTEISGDNATEDRNISVTHLTEDCTAVEIMYTVRSGLDVRQCNDILALLPYLNRYLSIGAFGLLEQNGYFYFHYAFAIRKETEVPLILETLAATLTITDATVQEAILLTAPVLRGELTADDRMREETSITQF